jgi:hypothetical protein
VAVQRGYFDKTAVPDGWFDATEQAVGWFDADLLDIAGGPTAYTLTADAGSFTLSGQDANLTIGRILTADAGAFTLSGQDAALSVGRVITADAGAFTLTGQDATLTVTPAGGTAYTLTADAGDFALTGQDAQFVISTGATDTHDGYWHKQWLKLRKKPEMPTIAEVAEAVKEHPVEAIAEVRAAVVAKYPEVDYEAVRQNIALQRFIAKLIIDAAREEDDIEILLLA